MPESRPALSARQAVFRAVASTVVPEAARLSEAEWDEMMARVEASLRPRPASVRSRLRLFLLLIEWLPVLYHGRRLTRLAPSGRARFLRRLQEHSLRPIRLGFWGVRTLAFLGYYGRDAAALEIGYRPHPRGWKASNW